MVTWLLCFGLLGRQNIMVGVCSGAWLLTSRCPGNWERACIYNQVLPPKPRVQNWINLSMKSELSLPSQSQRPCFWMLLHWGTSFQHMSFGRQLGPGRMVHAFNQGQVAFHVSEASLVSFSAVREGYKGRPSDDKAEDSSFLLLSPTHLTHFYSLFTGHSSLWIFLSGRKKLRKTMHCWRAQEGILTQPELGIGWGNGVMG